MLVRDEYTENQRLRRIQELRSKWNAPPRHVRKTPDITGKWGEAFAKVRCKLARGCFIALIGNRGTGKTQIAVEAMKITTQDLRSAVYETAYGFFLRIREAYKADHEYSERQIIAEFRKPALLVLDEIAKRSDKEWQNHLLFHLLDCRYLDEKDTIIISNQPEPEFREMLGPSLSDRMKETGGIITCDWESFR